MNAGRWHRGRRAHSGGGCGCRALRQAITLRCLASRWGAPGRLRRGVGRSCQLLLLHSFKPVAHPVHGGHDEAIGGPQVQQDAQARDVGVERAGHHIGHLAPDDFLQMIARQQLPHVLEQEEGEVVLAVFQLNGGAVDLNGPRLGQKPVAPEFQYLFAWLGVCAAQQCGHPRSARQCARAWS